MLAYREKTNKQKLVSIYLNVLKMPRRCAPDFKKRREKKRNDDKKQKEKKNELTFCESILLYDAERSLCEKYRTSFVILCNVSKDRAI